MDQEILPSLTAFRNKCAPNLFDHSRFKMGNDSVGFNKGVGLSRVAVWSAINDVFKLTHAITPGQAATIVDASPIIVGPDALARLSRMERLSELDHEVRTKSSSWVQGIVSYSQLWSVARAASVDLPRDFLLNSKVEAPHYPQAAMLAAVVSSGIHKGLCPTALHHALSAGSEFCRSVPHELLDAALHGDWGFLQASGKSQDLASRIEKALPGPDPSVRPGTGAFLGATSITDLRQLCHGKPGKQRSTSELLAHTPFGLHAMFVAKRVTGMNPDDDLMGAAIEGVNRAWETFSPIIIPQQSITQTKARLGPDRSAEQGEFALDAKKYQGSRLPTAVDIWVRKYVQEARGKTHGAIGIPRTMQTLMGELKKRAQAISLADEMPFPEALIVASEEMEVADLKKAKPAIDFPMLLNQAKELLLGAGTTVRLDADPEAGGRNKHETIAAEDPNAFRQTVFDANMPVVPGKVPLQFPSSHPDRFDELYNFARVVKCKSADSLIHLAAGTRNISKAEVVDLEGSIKRYAENPALSQRFGETLSTVQSFLQGAGYSPQSMFSTHDAEHICAKTEEREGFSIGAQIYAQLRAAAKTQLNGNQSQQAL
jgi:hypothetical protein